MNNRDVWRFGKASAIWQPSQSMATPGYNGGLGINQANAESRTIELVCRVIEVSSSCFTGTILGGCYFIWVTWYTHSTLCLALPTLPPSAWFLSRFTVLRIWLQSHFNLYSKIDAALEVPTTWWWFVTSTTYSHWVTHVKRLEEMLLWCPPKGVGLIGYQLTCILLAALLDPWQEKNCGKVAIIFNVKSHLSWWMIFQFVNIHHLKLPSSILLSICHDHERRINLFIAS